MIICQQLFIILLSFLFRWLPQPFEALFLFDHSPSCATSQLCQRLIAHVPDAVCVGLFTKILAISLHIRVWAVNHFFAPVIYKVIAFFANYIPWHNHSPFGGCGSVLFCHSNAAIAISKSSRYTSSAGSPLPP